MYKVEKIVGKRPNLKKKGKFEYLVKWEGWSEKNCTWEPEKHLQYVKDLIEEFQNSQQQLKEVRQNHESMSSLISISDSNSGHEREESSKSIDTKKLEESKQKSRSRQNKKDGQRQKKKRKDQKVSEQLQGDKKQESTLHSIQNNQNKRQKQVELPTDNGSNQSANESSSEDFVFGHNFNIVGMKKQQDCFWYFIMQAEGKSSWVSRDYLIKHCPEKLCLFYESRIVFST